MNHNYKLTYFNMRARGEMTRLLFALGEIEYEDIRIPETKWAELKPSLPNNQVPTLEIDGTVYCQSHAINRYIAKQLGIAGKSPLEELRADMIVDTMEDFTKPILQWYYAEEQKKEEIKRKLSEKQVPQFMNNLENMLIGNRGRNGYFVGDEMTWADLYFVDNVSWLEPLNIPVDWSRYPKLAALKEKILKLPKIDAWIKKRPESSN